MVTPQIYYQNWNLNLILSVFLFTGQILFQAIAYEPMNDYCNWSFVIYNFFCHRQIIKLHNLIYFQINFAVAQLNFPSQIPMLEDVKHKAE